MRNIIQLTKAKRNFNPENYIDKKIQRINDFFYQNSLNSCVIGISGGIDSAVAYKLLVSASKLSNSPLKKIVALIMPIYSQGTSNQEMATKRGLMAVEESDTCTYYVNDLSSVLKQYCFQTEIDPSPNEWAVGQLASTVRTPNLYFHAALLQQQGYKSIVVGTTNRDEGAYIGFFGKASDGMVDLQPIADAHKSEIIEIAKVLNVHEDIIQAIPSGDVWDGKTDEEMIGAPYWFLEMYLLMKEHAIEPSESMSKQDIELFNKYSWSIEGNHSKNMHKYKVGSPAHFIDVQPRAIPNGWSL